MDFSNIALFNIMKTKMDVLSQRQAVLSQNIANADTPNYKSQNIADPDFSTFLKNPRAGGAQKLAMAVTDPGHMVSTAAQNPTFKTIKTNKTSELNPNGNNVVIEDELSKMAMNQADYQKMLNLYGKTISMFKTAIGTGSS